MRNLLIILIVVISICSCRKETTYQMQIFIKNNTASKFKVTLFPKSRYMQGGLYAFCDFGGGYADTIIDIDINEQMSLYMSGNLDQEPYDLASLIFDSIYVRFYDDNRVIKFLNDSVIGYSDNLFKDNSIWIYEKKNYSLRTNFSKHPIESHDYTFEISQ